MEAVRQGIRPQDLHLHLYSILLLPAAVRGARAEVAAAVLPIPAAAGAAVHPIPVAAAGAAAQAAQEDTVAVAVAQGLLVVVHHPLRHTVAAAEAEDNIYKIH